MYVYIYIYNGNYYRVYIHLVYIHTYIYIHILLYRGHIYIYLYIWSVSWVTKDGALHETAKLLLRAKDTGTNMRINITCSIILIFITSYSCYSYFISSGTGDYHCKMGIHCARMVGRNDLPLGCLL